MVKKQDGQESVAARRERMGWVALWWLLSVPALMQIALMVRTVAARFGYAYDLEWMEGAVLHHAWRIGEGLSSYHAPSVDFVPFLYTPLYPTLVALLGKVVGISYQSGRAVSLLSVAVVMGVMALMVVWSVDRIRPMTQKRMVETGSLVGVAALSAMAVYASGYPWTYGWYDIARVDSMLVALVSVALYLLRIWGRPSCASEQCWGFWDSRIALCAALLGASFFVKQTGVMFVAAGGAALFLMNWRMVPLYVGITGCIGLGGTYLANLKTGGWFWAYVYQYHQRHGSSPARFWGGFTGFWERYPQLVCLVGVAAVALIAYVAVKRKMPKTGGCFLFWSWIFAVSVFVSATGLATQWSELNAYIPALVFGGFAAAISLVLLFEMALKISNRAAHVVVTVALAALALQAYSLRWEPAKYIPTAAASEAGDRLLERIRATEGEVFVPFFPWYAHLAGKEMTLHRMNITDVTQLTPRKCPPLEQQQAEGKKCEELPEGGDRVAGIDEKVRSKAYELIIYDKNPRSASFYPGLKAGYRIAQMLPDDEYPVPVTAYQPKGLAIWKRIEPLPMPADSQVLFDFEASQLEGWQITGRAWGRGPVGGELHGQQIVGGFGGRRLMNSFHGGDRTTGRAVSPAFEIRGETLMLRVGGGNVEGVAVELQTLDGRVLHSARGDNTEVLREVRWDVSALVGQQVRLVLVDEATGGWGHLLVDEVWELAAAGLNRTITLP